MVLPFVSARAHRDPRTYSTFTLNQFNLLVQYRRAGLDFAQMHLYPYNPVFEDALPGPLRRNDAAKAMLLRRITACLGYLPSWASPSVNVKVGTRSDERLPEVHLSSRSNPATPAALARVFSRLLSVAPALDLWPVIPSLRLSGPAKSYHFGGSFPHVSSGPRRGQLETDLLGRPQEWDRIHLIDASVFPSVAATTFTLTIMANAHRITSGMIKELD